MRWRRIATIFLFFGKFEGNFDFPAGKIKYSPTEANVILTVLETERQREEGKKKKS